jgi:diguanylate cyclase
MDFTYNTGLVALSIAVAMLGSFTGLVMTSGIRRIHGKQVGLRIMLGGLGIGGGIWSMHFIAMLAVVLPIPLSYDIPKTLTSAVVAVLFTSVALWTVASRRLGQFSLPLSALFLGLAIASMHYMGMAAIVGCGLRYSVLGVGVSVMIAIEASAVALWFTFRQRGVLDTFLGSAALGLAIALMHYTAMDATRFLPADSVDMSLGLAFSEPLLAMAIAVMLYSVCSICLVVYAILTFYVRPARFS